MIKRLPLILLIAIPAAGVVMSSITMYFAFSGPDQEMQVKQAPMSKTSWRPEEPRTEAAEPEQPTSGTEQ